MEPYTKAVYEKLAFDRLEPATMKNGRMSRSTSPPRVSGVWPQDKLSSKEGGHRATNLDEKN